MRFAKRRLVVMLLLLWAAFPLLSHAVYAQGASPGPVGRYDVDGESASGTAYKGTVEVTKTGDTFKVVWTFGNGQTTGTGIYGPQAKIFAVTYKQGKDAALVVYGEMGTGWLGGFAVDGDTKVGLEKWVRQN